MARIQARMWRVQVESHLQALVLISDDINHGLTSHKEGLARFWHFWPAWMAVVSSGLASLSRNQMSSQGSREAWQTSF